MADWLSSVPPEASKTALAGALGGLVRWLTLREDWKTGLISLTVGSICSLYLGPLVFPMIEPVLSRVAPEGDSRGFASFVVGLTGISLSGFLIDFIRARSKKATKP